MLVANSIMRRLGGEPGYAARHCRAHCQGRFERKFHAEGLAKDSLVASLGTMQKTSCAA